MDTISKRHLINELNEISIPHKKNDKFTRKLFDSLFVIRVAIEYSHSYLLLNLLKLFNNLEQLYRKKFKNK